MDVENGALAARTESRTFASGAPSAGIDKVTENFGFGGCNSDREGHSSVYVCVCVCVCV